MSQYANKTGAEIVHDYVVVRGDLSEQYARDQLAEVIDQRTARAEAAEAKIARVETLRDELIALPHEPGDSVFAEGYTAGSNEAGYFLRAALADEGDTDE